MYFFHQYIFFPMTLSLLSLLTWPSCITSVLNIMGWSYLPIAEASVALCTIPIGLRATLSPIRHTSVRSSLIILAISVPSLHPYLPYSPSPPPPIITSLSPPPPPQLLHVPPLSPGYPEWAAPTISWIGAVLASDPP